MNELTHEIFLQFSYLLYQDLFVDLYAINRDFRHFAAANCNLKQFDSSMIDHTKFEIYSVSRVKSKQLNSGYETVKYGVRHERCVT